MNKILTILLIACCLNGYSQPPKYSHKYFVAHRNQVVLLDRYYNNEQRKDSSGEMIHWHYDWSETSNGGFSLLADLFRKAGYQHLKSLDVEPYTEVLKEASVYIIVDPDNKTDNPTPNYMTGKAATIISDWVKSGGTLLLMANDSINCDLKHFNILASKFGIRFSNHSINMVKNDEFETGAVIANESNVFRKPTKLFLKDISELEITSPAKAVVKKDNKVIFASANYGKGKVLAVGDPWIYNEYIDHKRLPKDFENLSGAIQMVEWICNCKIQN